LHDVYSVIAIKRTLYPLLFIEKGERRKIMTEKGQVAVYFLKKRSLKSKIKKL